MIKKPKINKSGKVARVDPRGIVRGEKTRVKTARYRKSSSTRWLQRQLNDPYVAAAKRDGYRSRAAYKLLEIDDRFSFLHGVHTVVDLGVEMDFTIDEAEKALLDLIDGPIDLVMSDMAAATTGHQNTDYIRTLGLVELAFDFAKKTLAKNGTFVAKVFSGGTDTALLKDIRANFTKVRHFKPPASRSESKETYLVAQRFKKSS